MKNKLLRIAGVSVVALLVALAITTGCGKKKDTASSAPPPTQPHASPVKVVALLPLTGPAASYGQQMKTGIELATGTLDGVTVEYVDSKGKPAEAVAAANQFAANRGNTPTGFLVALSAVSKAVVPATERQSIPTVLTCVANPGTVQPSELVQQLFWTTDDFLPPVAEEIDRRHKKLAILTLTDDYGRACESTIKQNLDSCEIVLTETFPIGGGDVGAIATKVAATKPDAVFLGGFGPNFLALITQTKTRLPGADIYTSMDLGNPQVRKALGDAAEGIIFPALSPDLGIDLSGTIAELKEKATGDLGSPVYVAVCFYAHDGLLRLVKAVRGGDIAQPAAGEVIAGLPGGGLVLGIIRDGKPVKLHAKDH